MAENVLDIMVALYNFTAQVTADLTPTSLKQGLLVITRVWLLD